METKGAATDRPVAFSFAGGVLGGLALVFVVKMLPPLMFIVGYGAVILGTALLLRFERVQPFARRFGECFGVLVFSSIITAGYVITTRREHPLPASGFILLFFGVLLFASIVSAAVAQLTATKTVD